jgi:hypothetical protein
VFHHSSSRYPIAARVKRWVRARKNRIKGERKVERNQSNEHLCTTTVTAVSAVHCLSSTLFFIVLPVFNHG